MTLYAKPPPPPEIIKKGEGVQYGKVHVRMQPTGQVELGATHNRTAEISAQSTVPFGEDRNTPY